MFGKFKKNEIAENEMILQNNKGVKYNSKLSVEAEEKLSYISKTFNSNLLVYTIDNNRKRNYNNKVKKADELWDQHASIKLSEKESNKPESGVILAQIVMIGDKAPDEFKNLLFRSVMINAFVGKTYWLSEDKSEELVWIDPQDVYGLINE